MVNLTLTLTSLRFAWNRAAIWITALTFKNVLSKRRVIAAAQLIRTASVVGWDSPPARENHADLFAIKGARASAKLPARHIGAARVTRCTRPLEGAQEADGR